MEYNAPHTLTNQWKLPVNFAIAFHLLIALSAIYLPGLLKSKPRYENIYTVSLINIAAAPAPQPATPPQQTTTPPKETPPSKKAVAIAAKPPVPVQQAAPKKAISIKPKHRKIKRKIPPKPTQPDKSEFRRKQQLEEMRRILQEAEREAQRLQEEAALERKLMQHAQYTPPSPGPKTGTKQASSSRVQGNLSAIERQYYTVLTARLQEMWTLPEYKNLDPTLSAKVIITIRKNGEIADHFFEKKSGDRIFDRFVMKTLSDVGNLPPIPPALKKQRLEIGLIFSPGQIR